MSRGVCSIGFNVSKSDGEGVYEQGITESRYMCWIKHNKQRVQQMNVVNQEYSLTTDIQVMLDPVAQEHMYDIVYVIHMGKAWQVTNILYEYPRVTLSLGGLYHGQTAKK